MSAHHVHLKFSFRNKCVTNMSSYCILMDVQETMSLCMVSIKETWGIYNAFEHDSAIATRLL
jgi:hypothetical protein